MIKRGNLRARRIGAVALLALGSGLLVATGSPSTAQTGGVTGRAYGYSLTVSLFGGVQPPVVPTPAVELPAGGSATPVTADALTGDAKRGPAQFFSSGPIAVSTEGTSGGTVTSSAEIQTLNTSGQESLTADSIVSTCEATGTNATGSTTITNGTLLTDSGEDLNDDGDYTDAGEHPPVEVALPTDPAANTSYDGHIHVNGAQDNFKIYFNEQVTDTATGYIKVNAVHQDLLGPTAVGDLYIGQVECSATAAVTTTTTTVAPATSTTVAGGGTTTGGTTGGTGQQPLARTGGANSKLVIPAASALLLGAMLLFGFGDRPGWAGATAARRIHRNRAPWDRRRK